MAIDYKLRGIGSEFGLSPRLLKRPAYKTAIPLKSGRLVWLNSGRDALKWAWASLSQHDTDRNTCLLPAYLCHSVLQPFRELGTNVEFYRVDDDLDVDLDDLLTRINSDVLAIVIIHYFGIPQSDDLFLSIKEADPAVTVIEDMSHAWLSSGQDGRPVGQRDTITVYSPRKFFPVPDGGIAVVAKGIDLFDSGVAPSSWRFTLWRTLGLLLRHLFAQTGFSVANRAAFSLLHRTESILDSKTLTREASWVSKRILNNLDYKTAVKSRCLNYKLLLEGVGEGQLPIRPLYEKLPAGVTPLGFPILCERRDELRQFLIQRRIYPPVHWLLPQEPGITKYKFLTDLSNRILTLPLDQRYGPGEMDYILSCLTEWKSIS